MPRKNVKTSKINDVSMSTLVRHCTTATITDRQTDRRWAV